MRISSLDGVKRILPRYVNVMENELPANFQILKRIDGNESIEKFYEIRKNIDEGNIRLDKLEIYDFSLLDKKIEKTEVLMKSCELCERMCHVDRSKEKGVCGVYDCRISSDFMHIGEEFFISPSHTIFFMGCTFKCEYCQNWTISQWHEDGMETSPDELAKLIRYMRNQGSRNVNFVGGEPTPSLLYILQSLKLCNSNVPVVWNSNFYMSEKSMEILEGVVDLHLSDFKYGNSECAKRLSHVDNYFDIAKRNHLIAAKEELAIRHLILPNHIECCSKPIMKWIAENIKDRCIVNIMDQYRPEYKALEHKDINRMITNDEFKEVIKIADDLKINYIV